MQKYISPSTDSQGVTLYAPTSATSQIAFPVIATSSGALLISTGIDVPPYDSLILSYSTGNLSNVYFLVGGTAGTLVATYTLSYSGGNLTAVQRS